jgi:hypothetical protein
MCKSSSGNGDVDGTLVVRARLTPEQGAIWLKALEKGEEVIDSDEGEFQIRQADALTHALEESLLDPLQDATEGTSTADRLRVADHYQAVIHVPVHALRVST